MPLAVLAISIASLLASWHSERSMEALVEQNSRLVRAQSTPLLMFDSSNMQNNKPVITMTVSNAGTGPAQIFWLKLSDAQGMDYSGGALTERVMKLSYGLKPFSQRVSSTIIRSGDERLVFGWPKPTDSKIALAEWEKVNQARFHLHVSACYCSMFEECKITDFGVTRPKTVESCAQGSNQPG